jgi:hypothetical protein
VSDYVSTVLVVKNPDKLPKSLPPDVRLACRIAALVEATADDSYPWGTSNAHLLRLVHVEGDDKPSVGVTPLDWGFKGEVADAVEQLKMLGGRELLDGPRGRHLGLVVVCEVWRLREDAEQELAELMDGAPSQRPYELRMAIGALISGWHLVLDRPRGGKRTLRVARPQDALDRQYFSRSVVQQLHRLNADFTVTTR